MDLPRLPDDAPPALLLGFSGGRDSTALLHRMAALRDARGWAVRAIHVDHGLHEESARWAAACVEFAGSLGIDCAVRRVEVARVGSLEAAARRARWSAFADERRHDETLVLAQHRDDQVETLLLALQRGSGEQGLGGMRPWRVDARGPVWRPLLALPASAIAAYAAAHGLRWIEDPSNADRRHARNRLRHDLLPAWRVLQPGLDEGLAHSAARLAEADALLQAQARDDLAMRLRLDPTVLPLQGVHAMGEARASRLLRAWVQALGGTLSRDAIARVLGPWQGQPPARALRHAQGAHWLRQWGGQLWWTPRHEDPPPLPHRPWQGEAVDLGAHGRLVANAGLDLPAGGGLVDRRGTRGRIRLQGRERRASDVLAGLGVPPWQRDAVPLWIDATGRVLAVADLAYADDIDAWLGARGGRLRWQPGLR